MEDRQQSQNEVGLTEAPSLVIDPHENLGDVLFIDLLRCSGLADVDNGKAVVTNSARPVEVLEYCVLVSVVNLPALLPEPRNQIAADLMLRARATPEVSDVIKELG